MNNKVLVIDIGNSYTKFAYFLNNKIKKFYYDTPSNKNIDISKFLKLDFSYIVISSVVNDLTKIITNKFKKYSKAKIINISSLKKNIKIDVNVKKKDIGGDLLADLIACKNDYKSPCIIFDIGTVSKVLALDKNNTFIGCSFFLGLSSTSKSLFHLTDALPHIEELSIPKKPLGKDTNEAILSGIVYGNIYSINGFINEYKKILGKNCKVIFTGGGAHLIYKKFKNIIYDPYLTVNGIYDIYLDNINKKKI